ncbi:MAG: hypothetical protein WEB53_17380 [Akkermansiaceae bacterium]
MKSTCWRSSVRGPTHLRAGFALIVTLSLMILLTVIAVGLLTLSSISMRSSSQGEAMSAARANARLSLMLALGDLQKQLGPDTRISTTADQIAAADPAVSSTPQSQRHWTGGYKAWSVTAVTRPANPEFLQWFVSGAPSVVTAKSFAATALGTGAATSVEIVSPNSVGTGDPVRVPLISQSVAGAKNNYAWWVGDEGVKAYVPSDPTLPANGTSDQRLAMQAAPNMGLKVMADATGTKTPLAALDQESEAIRKLVSFKQTELALDAASRSDLKLLFHDVTTHNRGLLTNVRAGGFRQDLSMVLQAPANSVPKTALYTAGGRNGINLAELWAYHNLCGELTSLSGKYTTGDSIPVTARGLQQKTTLTEFKSDKFYHQKQPVFIRFQQLISFLAKPTSPVTNPPNYSLGIVIDPIITLWNPLDVPLSLQGSFSSIKYFALPYDLKINFNGVENRIPLGKITGSPTNPQGGNFLSMRIGNGAKPLILKPGEVMTFSQKNAPTSTSGGGAQQVEAQPGWVYDPTGGGFYYPFSAYRAASLVSGAGVKTLSYSVTPNTDKSLGSNYASAHHIYYKYDRPDKGQESQSVGYYTINNRITASDPQYLSFFDKITPSPMIPLGQLTSKRPFMIFSFLAKTEKGAENSGRFLARNNPRAIRLDFYDLAQSEQRMMPFEIKTEAVTSVVGMDQSVGQAQANGNSYFGGGWTAEYGLQSVITHSIPRQPPVSLAAFQHSLANGFPVDANGRINTNSLDYLYPQISHAIGNSLAPSLLAENATDGMTGGSRPLADHSYLANQALWDDYFLSGISPQTTSSFATLRDQKTVATEFLDSTKPLPVKHYKPNLQGRDASAVLAKLISGKSPAAGAEKLTASLISVEGMFNVNSTSIEAWKAMLSSLRDRNISGQNISGGEITIPATPKYSPTASLLTPANGIVKTGSSTTIAVQEPEQWAGVHLLSDTEIEMLAKGIVREVRKRGPFLSLADFINRRVGNDKALALSGAIQSALDADTVTINKPFRTGDRAATGSEEGIAFPEAERGAAAYGIPGYVKQADILTPIAPLLSARSDTFVIRGYGEKTNAAGTVVIARACCEAVVQRGSGYVDPAEEMTVTPPLRPTNQTFGRRFEIVSFRWLNASEV